MNFIDVGLVFGVGFLSGLFCIVVWSRYLSE